MQLNSQIWASHVARYLRPQLVHHQKNFWQNLNLKYDKFAHFLVSTIKMPECQMLPIGHHSKKRIANSTVKLWPALKEGFGEPWGLLDIILDSSDYLYD